MRRRHPLPKIWLMTDPRLENLEAVIRALPRGAGIIFRHYDLPHAERLALFKRAIRSAKARQHLVLLADRPAISRQWGADGAHNRSLLRSQGVRTVAVHTARDAVLANRVKADLIFVSPVYVTRSHPDGRPIGSIGLARLAGRERRRTIALGGMTAARMKALRTLGIHGWAAIDAFRI